MSYLKKKCKNFLVCGNYVEGRRIYCESCRMEKKLERRKKERKRIAESREQAGGWREYQDENERRIRERYKFLLDSGVKPTERLRQAFIMEIQHSRGMHDSEKFDKPFECPQCLRELGLISNQNMTLAYIDENHPMHKQIHDEIDSSFEAYEAFIQSGRSDNYKRRLAQKKLKESEEE